MALARGALLPLLALVASALALPAGYAGDCPNACSSHGRCAGGVCSCEDGWGGLACDERQPRPVSSIPTSTHLIAGSGGCPDGCSMRGTCAKLAGGRRACACYPGCAGPSCAQKACPNECNGHGQCLSQRELAFRQTHNLGRLHGSYCNKK